MPDDKIERVVPIASAVPSAVAELLRRSPLSPGKVAFAWRAAVGAALERATQIRLERGALIVEAQTPQWAREVSRSSSMILRRLQTLLGENAVDRIEVHNPASPRP
jgi:hypothetical protein